MRVIHTMSTERLFLDKPVLAAARELLGCYLVRRTEEGICRVRIVETEAYSEDDPASHSYNGATPRSEIMFGPPAHWYVYKCYGIHWMINVVTGSEGTGEAVLIRSAEPVAGRSLMETRRGQSGPELTNGPGKLAEALAVNKDFDGEPVRDEDRFWLEPGITDEPVFESPRVGIQEAERRHWRFFLENEYLSKVKQNDSARRRN